MAYVYDEQLLLKQLPPEDRKAFLALDPAERRFLLTASDGERQFYASLPPQEQTRFSRLPPELRAEYVRLTPSEKRLMRGVDAKEMQRYLTMKPGERQSFAASSPVAQQQRRQTQETATRAGLVARETIALLGKWAVDKPQLAEKASTLAHNLFHAGKSEAVVRAEILSALLTSKEILPRVSKELAARMDPEKLNRAQPLLAGLIATRVKPELTSLEAIFQALKDAIEDTAAKPVVDDDDDDEEEISGLRFAAKGGISGR